MSDMDEKSTNSNDLDGFEPDEEVGPEGCAVPFARTIFDGAGADQVQDCEWHHMDELHDQFPIEEVPVILDKDGIATVITPPIEDVSPFTYDCVCLEDDREYVELFEEEAKELIDLDIVYNIYMGIRSMYDRDGSTNDRLVIDKEKIVTMFGKLWVEMALNSLPPSKWTFSRSAALHKTVFIPVRPRRPICEYYKRQVFANDNIPNKNEFGHQIVYRVCTARRSNGGSFLSVGNEVVYTCDFRSPRDLKSEQVQDLKDKKKLKEEPHLERVPLFGIEK